MNLRNLILATGVVLVVSMTFWMALPGMLDNMLAQMFFAAVAYLLELILLTVLIMGMIEGAHRLLIAAAVTGIIVGAIPGIGLIPMGAFIPIWLKLVVPSMIVGLLISRGWHPGKSFAVASVLMGLFIMVNYPQWSVALNGLIAQMNDGEAINAFLDNVTYFWNTVRRLAPGMVILSGLGQLFVAFLLTDMYYTRKYSYFPGFGPFIYWKIPEKLLYFLGAVLIVRLTIPGEFQVAADNVIFILSVFYAVCGLALVEHLLRRLRLPLFIRAIFYFGLFLMQVPGLIMTSIAGLFDSYFDFRKVRAHTLG
jgi:hypothetical protein